MQNTLYYGDNLPILRNLRTGEDERPAFCER